MTEKRFNLVKCKEHRWGIEDNTLEKEDKLFFICREGQFETNGLVLLLNQLNDENEQLKHECNYLQNRLDDFINIQNENEQLKQTLRMVEKRADKVYEENEQLKKDATTLIYANQDYRQQNLNLQEELDYIQNSITNAIKHQKTELGVKALQEIIQDYNEWMLGHKEVKE